MPSDIYADIIDKAREARRQHADKQIQVATLQQQLAQTARELSDCQAGMNPTPVPEPLPLPTPEPVPGFDRIVAHQEQIGPMQPGEQIGLLPDADYPIGPSTLIMPPGASIRSTDPTAKRPTIWWTGAASDNRMMTMEGTNTLDGVHVDGIHGPARSNGCPTGIACGGIGNQIRRCRFSRLATAINCEGGVNGLTVDACSFDVLGMYAAWLGNPGSPANDVTFTNCVIADSLTEHNIRGRNVHRLTIDSCHMTNPGKSCVWILTGAEIEITRSTFVDGVVAMGPHSRDIENGAADALDIVGIHDNTFIGSAIGVHAGCHACVIDSNTFTNPHAIVISVNEGRPEFNRLASGITIRNNEITTDRVALRVVYIPWGDVPGLVLADNVVDAPNAEAWGDHRGNVYAEDNQTGLTSSDNEWQLFKARASQQMRVGGRWFDASAWRAIHPSDTFR